MAASPSKDDPGFSHHDDYYRHYRNCHCNNCHLPIEIGDTKDLSQPEEFPKVLEQETAALQPALEQKEAENAVLWKENAVLRKENAGLCEDKAALSQQLDACQQRLKVFEFMPEMRDLFRAFRETERGRAVDEELMIWARGSDKFRTSESTSFFWLVIGLETRRTKLKKDRKSLDLSCKEERSRIKAEMGRITEKLSSLKKVAADPLFKTREMKWSVSIGEEIYTWCILFANANTTFHRDVTKELLDDMCGHAEEYTYCGLQLDNAVKAVVDVVRR